MSMMFVNNEKNGLLCYFISETHSGLQLKQHSTSQYAQYSAMRKYLIYYWCNCYISVRQRDLGHLKWTFRLDYWINNAHDFTIGSDRVNDIILDTIKVMMKAARCFEQSQ